MSASLILRVSAPMLLWLPLAASLYVLLRGHNEPGGGFIGGLLAGVGLIFHAIAFGAAPTRKLLRLAPTSYCAIGVLLAAASGIPALLGAAGPYLTHLWWFPDIGIVLPLGTTILFDAGVYITVVGTVATLFLSLMEEETL
ncbi:MAG: Na(+)/H(+) antiporter subunit B [Alphaproteobacteria bacterium]|nr:Na(+)/H(+) antiporter subunit B [Alphaproteobacteria bacterium]